MVYKRSEYGLKFKVSSLVQNIPVYKDHLSYRHLRRERECAHTPIAWVDEVLTETDSDEKLPPAEDVEKLPISELMISEEEENVPGDDDNEEDDEVAREKREAKKKDIGEHVKETKESCDVEIVTQSEALRQSAKDKLNKYSNKENTEKAAESKVLPEKKVLGKTFVKPKVVEEKAFVQQRPRRPDRVGKLPLARPASAPSARPKSAASEKPGAKPKVENNGEQPFYNYGGGAVDRTLGEKKTFNVRASSAVYPAALRAKKRNLLLIEKQIERQKSASAREKRRRAKFNERMMRETALWESEYRRSYPAYENTEYKTSDREPRKQKSYFTS